jgi:hypothetical protein
VATWFGPWDGLLRTASALCSYLIIRAIQDHFGWDAPYLIGEGLAVVVAVAISGFFSTRVWGLPSLRLEWAVGDNLVEERVFHIRAGDARQRRVVTHKVIAPPASILSWLVIRRVARQPGVSLCVRVVPTGAFHTQEDISLPSVVFQQESSGFRHTIPDLGEAGLIALSRVVWEPLQSGLPVRCKLKYSLYSSASRGQWLLHLIHLDAKVKAVDLGQ